MKFLSLIDNEVHIAPGKKVIPAHEFEKLIEAKELLEKAQEEIKERHKQAEDECNELREKAKKEGFDEGLSRFNEQLAQLEKERLRVEEEMRKSIVPLALTAVKKIIGKEITMHPSVVTSVVKTALKPVSQHRKITIFVNKDDLDLVEKERAELKKLFEHVESLSIKVRPDVERGGCIIETEAGIINAQLESQLQALEAAFQTFFDTHKKKESE